MEGRMTLWDALMEGRMILWDASSEVSPRKTVLSHI